MLNFILKLPICINAKWRLTCHLTFSHAEHYGWTSSEMLIYWVRRYLRTNTEHLYRYLNADCKQKSGMPAMQFTCVFSKLSDWFSDWSVSRIFITISTPKILAVDWSVTRYETNLEQDKFKTGRRQVQRQKTNTAWNLFNFWRKPRYPASWNVNISWV
jgi:hypothetical protein